MLDDLKWLILWFSRLSKKKILRNFLICRERQIVSPQELQPGEAKSPGIIENLENYQKH